MRRAYCYRSVNPPLCTHKQLEYRETDFHENFYESY
jgi:hypothetical protein